MPKDKLTLIRIGKYNRTATPYENLTRLTIGGEDQMYQVSGSVDPDILDTNLIVNPNRLIDRYSYHRVS